MMDSVVVERASARFWPQGWWRLVEFRIGIVPLPVYVLLAALVTFFILRDGKIASDLPTMIAGSIFGMDRQVLIKGFLKIFVPLAAGSVVAGTAGTLIGVALGLGAYHT